MAAAAWLALMLAMASRRIDDPGFSTSGLGGPVQNWLGAPGAWVADVLLVLFGFSAWWLIVFGGRHVLAGWAALWRGD
ncbi:MAG TPA: DNA translocase FtsK 4TM domain-containing protein, partial [Burkholderiaceae bacterium]